MIFSVFFISCLLVFNLSFVQADSLDDQAPETEAMHEIKSDETMAEVETGGSVDGIVVNVNPISGSLALRDTDEDGQVYYLTVKKSTTYSGISSISDINPGDSISVDCYGSTGNLIAETITLQDRAYQAEKPEKLQKVLVD
ncbi:MAG: hypothetical protein NT014_06765 [Candidatus Omnitrophica bacterium]|nr:hypothetical protein [Candidatus Omnitrophota bacterium]